MHIKVANFFTDTLKTLKNGKFSTRTKVGNSKAQNLIFPMWEFLLGLTGKFGFQHLFSNFHLHKNLSLAYVFIFLVDDKGIDELEGKFFVGVGCEGDFHLDCG